MIKIITTIFLFLSFNLHASSPNYVETQNELSLKLFSSVYEAKSQESLVVSPVSLTSVVSMLAMSLSPSQSEKRSGILKTISGIERPWDFRERVTWQQTALNTEEPNLTIGFKNSFFANQELRPWVLDSYGATVEKVDFTSPEAVTSINNWASEATKGLINEMVVQEEISKLHFLALNAVYLDAKWAGGAFDSPRYDDTFYSETGEELKELGYMIAPSRQPMIIVEEEGYNAFQIPYSLNRAGEPEASMIVLHPQATNQEEVEQSYYGESDVKRKLTPLADVVKGLDRQALDKLMAQFAENRLNGVGRRFELAMPKFTVETTLETDELKTALSATGLGSLFTDTLDLSNMLSRHATEKVIKDWETMKIKLVKQKAKIEVAEEGTKAAAVSAIGGYPESCPPPRHYLNSPFMYLVVDHVSGVILFAGTYMGDK